MNLHSSTLFGTVAPELLVPDVAAAARYYRDRLGFKISALSGEPAEHAVVTRGNSQIFFRRVDVAAGTSNRRLQAAGVDAYFRVRGLEELYRALLDREVEILEGPVLREYGVREVVIEDLNGFVLVFGEEEA